MPLGGLKWRDELENKEFKKVKSEIQVLGIDDAPFERGDEDVKIVAVLTRGAKMLDGVFHSSIKKDGLDATDKIVQLIKDIKRENARAIILDGITFAGFNIADIDKIYKGTNIPVIASMNKRPDPARINDALRNLKDSDMRKGMIKAAGPIHEVLLSDNRKVYIQTAGINKKDAEEIIRLTTINGLDPEPIRAAHLIAKGAYTEIPKQDEESDLPHIKAYHYILDKHKHATRLKRRYLPGMVGEVFSFLFAVLVAWLIIQFLGFLLATSTPLVVVESESMVHGEHWENWYLKNGLDLNELGGALNIGDIILVKGDDTDDIGVGDVIVYTKLEGGEPIIHRIIGAVDVDGNTATTSGAVEFDGTNIVTPCNDESKYSLNSLRGYYSQRGVEQIYPDMNLDEFRLFITKGDNNQVEDQCKSRLISYPVHEDLVVGRAKFDIPYLGYVKLGLVCAFRFASGNVCSQRCWWSADNNKCSASLG